VRKRRLTKNPLSKANLSEGWTAPEARTTPSTGARWEARLWFADMLEACGTIGKRQGPRFRAFYGCMFYALMRPSEVAGLTREGCHLPEGGWGHLIFADSSPAAGRAYTDDGQVHEHRGLKGRTKGRPSHRARRPVRKVPILPELVASCARTSRRSARPRTGGCSGPSAGTRSSRHLVTAVAESPRRVPSPPSRRPPR
jgi:hypothetical protein